MYKISFGEIILRILFKLLNVIAIGVFSAFLYQAAVEGEAWRVGLNGSMIAWFLLGSIELWDTYRKS